jgi:phenylpropionate dioxygenase-like ring-hydroxylating dioxygenase large terminal subunit
VNAPIKCLNPANAAYSYTLPAEYYFSPETYRRELDVVFARSWIFACHLSQVKDPGQYVRCRVGEEEIVVTRDKAGTLRAFYNVCRHRAHTLLQEDQGTVNVIACPYHAWTYNLDGSLRTARNTDNIQDFCKAEFNLQQARVEEFCAFVWVNLDPEADSLASQAPDLEQKVLKHCPDLYRLKFAHRLTWDIKCNWKTAVDNFSECYHCAPAHRGFTDLVDMQTYTLATHGIWSIHVGPPGTSGNAPYKFTATDDRPQDYIAILLWPNLTIWVMPGAGNIAMLYMLPTGPETCTEYFDFYFMNETPADEEWASIVYLRDVLQPEDIALCEKVQKGLRSRSYNVGRLVVDAKRSGISEHATHHFQSLVLKAHGRT